MMIHLPWQGRRVPCAVLDILRGCNAGCSYCFCQEAPHLQSMSEIAANLDALLARRRLQAIMISGGEPTLHPALFDVIRLGASKGLQVILLTNGILLDDACAVRLREAGCGLCFLHIQTGQKRPDLAVPDDEAAVVALRLQKGKHLTDHGIIAGCCVTLRADQEAEFDAEITHFLAQNIFSHLLLTTAKDPADFDGGAPMCDVDIDAIKARYERRGFRVFAALGGRIDRRKLRWFAFQAVESRTADGAVRRRVSLRASGAEYLLMYLGAWVKGHYDFFLGHQSSAFLRCRLVVNGLTGGGLAPLGLAFGSWWRRETLHFRNLALETPPYRMADGRVEHCCDCPGAVLKDGRWKPLCLTDVALDREVE